MVWESVSRKMICLRICGVIWHERRGQKKLMILLKSLKPACRTSKSPKPIPSRVIVMPRIIRIATNGDPLALPPFGFLKGENVMSVVSYISTELSL